MTQNLLLVKRGQHFCHLSAFTASFTVCSRDFARDHADLSYSAPINPSVGRRGLTVPSTRMISHTSMDCLICSPNLWIPVTLSQAKQCQSHLPTATVTDCYDQQTTLYQVCRKALVESDPRQPHHEVMPINQTCWWWPTSAEDNTVTRLRDVTVTGLTKWNEMIRSNNGNKPFATAAAECGGVHFVPSFHDFWWLCYFHLVILTY